MKVKNFAKLQHFKDRCPPWIKLYRDILDHRDISLISDCSFRVLVGVWLLASEDKQMQGNLPSVDDIAFRLRMDKVKVINALKELKPFLYMDDIEVISERYQDDAPETETETKTKGEVERKKEEKEKKEKPQAASASRSIVSKPDDVSDQTWTDWVAHRKAKKATVTETVLKSIQAEAGKAGMNLEAALETMCARGWSGFKAEWVQTAGQSTAKSQIIGKSMGSAADEIVGQIFGDVLDGDCFFVKDILEIEKNGNA